MKIQFLAFLLFISAVLCPALPSFAQADHPKFIHLSTNEGLSQGHVLAILKDSKGFMWFATEEGLNKYDGYRFVIYRNEPETSSSLSNNFVNDVFEDRTGNIWVGTASGLDRFDREKDCFVRYLPGGHPSIVNDVFQDSRGHFWLATTTGFYLFDPATGKFTVYKHQEQDPSSLSDDCTYRIAEDNEGNLWVASKNGLDEMEKGGKGFISFRNDPSNPKSIGSSWVKAVYKDHKGNIWAGTQGNGIALYQPADKSFLNFHHEEGNAQSITHNDILSFTEDNQGTLWVGTENGGISLYHPETKTFSSYQAIQNDNTSLSNNSIHSLYRDDIGNMWVGTWSGGVCLLPRYGDKFRQYKEVHAVNNLGSNSILSVTGDAEGNIWLGTDGGGLNCFRARDHQFIQYLNDPKNPRSIHSDYVNSVIEVEPGILGLGYHRGGFDLFNTRTGVATHHLPDQKNANSLSIASVTVVFKDHAGMIWLGTWGGGLNLFDQKKNEFIRYQNNPGDTSSLGNNFIHSIFEDKDGDLWVGTDVGLELLDKSRKGFVHYTNRPGDSKSLSSNMVESMLQDQAGNFWLGTRQGLNLFNKKTGECTTFTMKEGLANNTIRSILEDGRGNLWISSNRGIMKFDPITKYCRNYGLSDGLQGNEFKSHCAYQKKDGEMFFGGPNGFNSFYPDSIKDNNFVPPVYITDFRLYNQPVVVGAPDSLLKSVISETKAITLSYKQSVITFEFSALNYMLPENNQYVYKLEGFDQRWNNVGTKRTATYTNLDPGHYTLLVKGSNNDGIWNDQITTLEITVTPPFWQTWWFRVLGIFLLAFCILSLYKARVRVIKAQQRNLQIQVRERTRQLARSMEEEKKARQEAERATLAKSIFLATMSHEIRTPMNGVIGMASLLAQTELTGLQREYTNTITSSGESLLSVINDILDFSKIESGNVELDVEDFAIRSCVEDVLDMFAARATEGGLDLIYQVDPNVPPQIRTDRLRLKQILTNLVGNALKFTHQGEIFVGVHLLGTSPEGRLELAFEVRDTGIGIPPDKLDRLFKAFSQVDSSTTRRYGGTGLGLTISEKLVQLMGGQIRVESSPGQGSVFTFSIGAELSSEPVRTYFNCNLSSQAGKKILVVDDNLTNRSILKGQLEGWNLLPVLAESGREALHILKTQRDFDLVITDMEMPGMDGVQFAQAVRERYPLLPVILLSSVGNQYSKQYPNLFVSELFKPIKQHELCKFILKALRHQPETAAEETAQPSKLDSAFSKDNPLQILVAEDNLINQTLIQHILTRLGYEPVLVDNGALAVEAIRHRSYDVVLMDMQMPEMDGITATQAIRELPVMKQPVIIALTANVMQGDEENCLKAGMDDYLSKPVKLETLVDRLGKWAGGRN